MNAYINYFIIGLISISITTFGYGFRLFLHLHMPQSPIVIRLVICTLLIVESGLIALIATWLMGTPLDTTFTRALIFVGLAILITGQMTSEKVKT